MITYPITPPPTPGPVTVSWNQLSVTALSRSPFTLRGQVFAWPGQQLGAVVEMPVMRKQDASAWQAFFAALRGREGTFLFGDVARFCKEERALGLPETVGTSQGRNVLSTNWRPETKVVSAGDWLSIGGKLRKVTQAGSSDTSGNAAFQVWPDMQAITEGAEIIWQGPKGIFRLTQDPPELVWQVNGWQAPFTFTCEEAD